MRRFHPATVSSSGDPAVISRSDPAPPLAAHYLFGTADMQRHLISFLVSCLQLAEGKSQSRQTSKGNKRAALRLCLLEESRRADRLVCHFSFVSCAPQQHPEQWQSVNASDMNGRHPEPSFSGLPPPPLRSNFFLNIL